MLEKALFSGESVNVEYKVEIPPNSDKYMKTVVAFANGRGGHIIFGIDDKSLKVVGIESDAIFLKIDAITNAILDSCEPKIYPNVTLQTLDDKTVIVVEIQPAPMRPYYIKSQGIVKGTYVRVAGTTRHAEAYMLKELILEGQNRYYDSEICKDITEVQDDEIEKLCREMKAIAIKNTLDESAKLAVRDITKNVLITWGVLKDVDGKILPTNAYALLTGQMLRQPVIQCAVFKGNTRAYFIDRREFDGPVQQQVEFAYQYVLEKINMGMQIKGIYRQDMYELPIDGIRELIANAVAHRSYLEPGNIQVALYDDRLEITSPGMLLNNVSVSKIMEGYSKLRNPAIASAFAYMKIIEKWGTGIPRIFRECTEYGLPEPELIDFDGDFRVNMYRKSLISEKQVTDVTEKVTDVTEKVTGIEAKILELISNDPVITTSKLANMLSVTRKTISTHMKIMKKNNVIERIGSDRKGYWKIL